MGHRELFLVLLSVVLLTALMVQINASTVDSEEALQELEIAHTAASIAQQYLEEARSKKFDANVGVIPAASMPGGFTPYNNLGPGWWESYPNFNDLDDFHNFVDTLDVNGVDYRVSVKVHYVRDSSPDVKYNDETYFKRMTVTVTSSWLTDPGMDSIIVKQVYSYFGVN
ncbi:hypothetical protein HUU05_24590 [candidate division KSB1 bacterium]|nr:hypothetical protein [candidate division KSB1 bacterium]